MNILILSWRGPGHPLAGGAEQVTLRHAQGWVKAGHTVTLFTSSYLNCQSNELKNGTHILRKGDQFFGVKFFAALHYMFGKHKKYDLVVDEFHGLPFFTPIYVRTKILCFVHEIAGPVWKLNPWPKPWFYFPAYCGPTVERLIFNLYRNCYFMTVSDSTAKDLRKFEIKNISVIINGLNFPKALPIPKKSKQPLFIFLSSLAKDKGIEDAIQAFKIIFKQLPQSKMIVAGQGYPDYVKFLKTMASDLPVTFAGFVSEARKYELLSAAHLLLFPSAHEGWGLVVIEANAVKTPTVAYKVSGLVDSIQDGHTGILTTANTPESLAQAALNLFNSPEYLKICTNAQDWSQNFTWKKSVHQSLELLSKIFK